MRKIRELFGMRENPPILKMFSRILAGCLFIVKKEISPMMPQEYVKMVSNDLEVPIGITVYNIADPNPFSKWFFRTFKAEDVNKLVKRLKSYPWLKGNINPLLYPFIPEMISIIETRDKDVFYVKKFSHNLVRLFFRNKQILQKGAIQPLDRPMLKDWDIPIEGTTEEIFKEAYKNYVWWWQKYNFLYSPYSCFSTFGNIYLLWNASGMIFRAMVYYIADVVEDNREIYHVVLKLKEMSEMKHHKFFVSLCKRIHLWWFDFFTAYPSLHLSVPLDGFIPEATIFWSINASTVYDVLDILINALRKRPEVFRDRFDIFKDTIHPDLKLPKGFDDPERYIFNGLYLLLKEDVASEIEKFVTLDDKTIRTFKEVRYANGIEKQKVS